MGIGGKSRHLMETLEDDSSQAGLQSKVAWYFWCGSHGVAFYGVVAFFWTKQ